MYMCINVVCYPVRRNKGKQLDSVSSWESRVSAVATIESGALTDHCMWHALGL